MCNDISEILGIKVKNLKITQNLGLHVNNNVQASLYEGQLTHHPSDCECWGIKNDNHLMIKHVFRKPNVYMRLIFERHTYLKFNK
ncbi:ISL3 family transposase, partial [Staphylococcus pseudintermedius]